MKKEPTDNERKYLQSMYLTKGLYPEHTENYQHVITGNQPIKKDQKSETDTAPKRTHECQQRSPRRGVQRHWS